jgi:hypothetical protein
MPIKAQLGNSKKKTVIFCFARGCAVLMHSFPDIPASGVPNVLICGESASGKSALVMRNLTGKFLGEHRPTTCCLSQQLMFFTNVGFLNMKAWDTPGGKEGLAQLGAVTEEVDGAIVCYDSERCNVLEWKAALRSHFGNDIPIVFARTKADVPFKHDWNGWNTKMVDLVRFQDERNLRVRVAMTSASLCFLRCGVCRDIRQVLAKEVWNSRFANDWHAADQKADERCNHGCVSTRSKYHVDYPFLLLARLILLRDDLQFVYDVPLRPPLPEIEMTPEFMEQIQFELDQAQLLPLSDGDFDL